MSVRAVRAHLGGYLYQVPMYILYGRVFLFLFFSLAFLGPLARFRVCRRPPVVSVIFPPLSATAASANLEGGCKKISDAQGGGRIFGPFFFLPGPGAGCTLVGTRARGTRERSGFERGGLGGRFRSKRG
jgi:hypothetical protein